MPHRYTQEQRVFIAANIKGRRYSALAELMSERFGIPFTGGQLHAYAQNHDLTNEMPSGPIIGERPRQIRSCTSSCKPQTEKQTTSSRSS